MSEQKAPYGYGGGDLPAQVDYLRDVQRAILDRVDRVYERVDQTEAKLGTRITDLEIKMTTTFADLRESQRVLAQMLTELLARTPPLPDSGRTTDQQGE
jgi:hypothetical protein